MSQGWPTVDPSDVHSMIVSNELLLIIDSRSFLEFNTSHIRNTVNMHCSRLVKRRLEQGKVSLAELLSQSCHIELAEVCDHTVVVYDQCTEDPRRLPHGCFLLTLLSKLQATVPSVLLLRGGFLAFQAMYPSLCESSSKAGTTQQTSLTSVSQPALPVSQVGPTRVLPYLYLGSQADALDQDVCVTNGISYVLNLSTTIPQPDFIQDSHFLRIPINDNYNAKMLPFLPQAFQFIEKVREANGCVLVHCLAGISRSPTLAIAFIMKTMNMASDDAYKYVKDKRPTVSPNFNFLGQLLDLEKELGLSRRTSISSPMSAHSTPRSTPRTTPCTPPTSPSQTTSPPATLPGLRPVTPTVPSPTTALARLSFDSPTAPLAPPLPSPIESSPDAVFKPPEARTRVRAPAFLALQPPDMFKKPSVKPSDRPSCLSITPDRPSSLGTAPGRPKSLGITPDRPSSLGTAPGRLSFLGTAPDRPNFLGTAPDRPSSLCTAPDRPTFLGTAPNRPSSLGTAPNRPCSLSTAPDRPDFLRTLPDRPSSLGAVPDRPSFLDTAPDPPGCLDTIRNRPKSLGITLDRPFSLNVVAEKVQPLSMTPERPKSVGLTLNRPTSLGLSPKRPSSLDDRPTSLSISSDSSINTENKPVSLDLSTKPILKPRTIELNLEKPQTLGVLSAKPEESSIPDSVNVCHAEEMCVEASAVDTPLASGSKLSMASFNSLPTTCLGDLNFTPCVTAGTRPHSTTVVELGAQKTKVRRPHSFCTAKTRQANTSSAKRNEQNTESASSSVVESIPESDVAISTETFVSQTENSVSIPTDVIPESFTSQMCTESCEKSTDVSDQNLSAPSDLMEEASSLLMSTESVSTCDVASPEVANISLPVSDVMMCEPMPEMVSHSVSMPEMLNESETCESPLRKQLRSTHQDTTLPRKRRYRRIATRVLRSSRNPRQSKREAREAADLSAKGLRMRKKALKHSDMATSGGQSDKRLLSLKSKEKNLSRLSCMTSTGAEASTARAPSPYSLFSGLTDTKNTGHTDTVNTGHTDTVNTGRTDTVITGHTDTVITGHTDTVFSGHTDTVEPDQIPERFLSRLMRPPLAPEDLRWAEDRRVWNSLDDVTRVCSVTSELRHSSSSLSSSSSLNQLAVS